MHLNRLLPVNILLPRLYEAFRKESLNKSPCKATLRYLTETILEIVQTKTISANVHSRKMAGKYDEGTNVFYYSKAKDISSDSPSLTKRQISCDKGVSI